MPDGSKIGAGKSTCKWCAGCSKVIQFDRNKIYNFSFGVNETVSQNLSLF